MMHFKMMIGYFQKNYIAIGLKSQRSLFWKHLKPINVDTLLQLLSTEKSYHYEPITNHNSYNSRPFYTDFFFCNGKVRFLSSIHLYDSLIKINITVLFLTSLREFNRPKYYLLLKERSLVKTHILDVLCAEILAVHKLHTLISKGEGVSQISTILHKKVRT